MAQRMVVKIPTMSDEKTKQKIMEAAARIYGVDSIKADVNEQKLTIVGHIDIIDVSNKLNKLGKLDIVSLRRNGSYKVLANILIQSPTILAYHIFSGRIHWCDRRMITNIGTCMWLCISICK